jgi:hypothetical protein
MLTRPLGVGFGLCGSFGGKRLPEALAGSRQERSGGDMADAESLGQLDTGQVVELGEQESGPLTFGDARQRALHVARQVGVHDEVLG